MHTSPQVSLGNEVHVQRLQARPHEQHGTKGSGPDRSRKGSAIDRGPVATKPLHLGGHIVHSRNVEQGHDTLLEVTARHPASKELEAVQDRVLDTVIPSSQGDGVSIRLLEFINNLAPTGKELVVPSADFPVIAICTNPLLDAWRAKPSQLL